MITRNVKMGVECLWLSDMEGLSLSVIGIIFQKGK